MEWKVQQRDGVIIQVNWVLGRVESRVGLDGGGGHDRCQETHVQGFIRHGSYTPWHYQSFEGGYLHR